MRNCHQTKFHLPKNRRQKKTKNFNFRKREKETECRFSPFYKKIKIEPKKEQMKKEKFGKTLKMRKWKIKKNFPNAQLNEQCKCNLLF